MRKDDIYTEYNDEKNQIPWLRMGIIAVLIVVVIFLILLLIKGCSKNSLREDLIEAAQSYYEKNNQELPKEAGECTVVTLSTLQNAGLVEDDFDTCNNNDTYVNVCRLENSEYNYAAILSCEKETTKYTEWKDGTISDLKEGSDVRFSFLGQYYTLADEETGEVGNKYYYPTDSSDGSTIDTYYVNSPADGYNNKDSETTGYKWYTVSQVKTYWNNGEYSATAPSGYVSKDSKTTVTKYSETLPISASYREINKVTLYRYKTVAAAYSFKCIVPGTDPKTAPSIISPIPCAFNESGFTQMADAYYTCDGGKTNVEFGTVCADYTNWSKDVCTSSSIKGIECQSKAGYEYIDTVYKWYKMTDVRNYYPSNSKTAEGENTYYVTSPVSGAIKDETTESKVYKFYKSDTNGSLIEKWIDVTDGYVSLEQLIESFNKLGYQVNNLTDIKSIEGLKYEIKMQYRDIEE